MTQMTDLELVKRCAERIGLELFISGATGNLVYRDDRELWEYDPLHDDAQAMALVKKFELFVEPRRQYLDWEVRTHGALKANADDLNRAIVECVARLP